MGDYCKHYGTQRTLKRLFEEWRANLDQNKISGTVLLDLSKTVGCIPHDLLFAKLNAHGFDREALKLIYFYLDGWKQSVGINNIYSDFLELLSGIPKGSILWSLLFNFFLNGLCFFITKASLHNYADDNKLSASYRDDASLMELLNQESNTTIDWLISNHMIVNPKKFQTIIITKMNLKNNPASSFINNMTIKHGNSVELGVTIDDKVTFEKHINKLCRTSSCQFTTYLD